MPVCIKAKAVTVWSNMSLCALLGELDVRCMAEYVDPVES